jgi:hypothetical protein
MLGIIILQNQDILITIPFIPQITCSNQLNRELTFPAIGVLPQLSLLLISKSCLSSVSTHATQHSLQTNKSHFSSTAKFNKGNRTEIKENIPSC